VTDSQTHVLLVRVELFIPQSNSLKACRKVVRSLEDRIRNRFNAAVAETGFQEKWQRAEISMAVTGNDIQYLKGQCDAMLRYTEAELLGNAQLINWSIEER